MRMLLLGLALGMAAQAGAATVYKTVDAAGKVSYSDTPPAQGVAAEVIDVPEGRETDPDAAARLDEMRATTDRMQADRRAREQERAMQYVPAYPAYPADPAYSEPAESEGDSDSIWMVPYYQRPPYWHGGGHRPRPPQRPPYVWPEPPPPNTGSQSPRGLQQRLRAAR
jgi:Domain of unknown function (DUF4124)